MAVVRVFLVTHRRPHLLRRALASLLAQSCSDWICELHNDAPDDDGPRAILAELAPADPRFTYCAHDTNWGAVAVFNHAFAGGPEPFASLLEDDNWWESDFLATALAALEQTPTAALAWGNMHIWDEQPDGTWHDTGRTVWRIAPGAPAIVQFHGPELLQAFDALHSNGAMVFRPDRFHPMTVSDALPFAIIEQARERAALGPLLLLTHPHGHFARTLTTIRPADPARWLQSKLIVAASFFATVPVSDGMLSLAWEARRKLHPRDTDLFFCLALVLRDWRLLRPARASDWFHFVLHTARHPWRTWGGLRFRREQSEVWRWFVALTQRATSRPVAASVLAKEIVP